MSKFAGKNSRFPAPYAEFVRKQVELWLKTRHRSTDERNHVVNDPAYLNLVKQLSQ